MAHLTLAEGLPGIAGPMAYRPETAKPSRALPEVWLRGANTLTSAKRELIAASTSSQKDCCFCQTSYGAVASHHLGANLGLDDQVSGTSRLRQFQATYKLFWRLPDRRRRAENMWPR